MRRKNYVPRQRSPEELRLEARYKVSWREPGPVNLEFQKAGILRPKVLNTWELDRVERPTKCYEKRILSKSKSIKFIEHKIPFKEMHHSAGLFPRARVDRDMS